MGLLWSFAPSIHFLLLSSLLSSMLTNCLPSVHHPTHECHEHESYALLQFKEGFVISKYASNDPSSYPKTESWMPSTDCCSWDGIECDEPTGHVIGIDLSSSQLYGSIDANSSLFRLVHLQKLNLADNDFNHSQIPARIGEFSKLRSLDLSNIGETTFSGEVPPEISQLSSLLSLDLRSYIDIVPPEPINRLQLNMSTLRSLIQNSTRLEELRLNFVTISSFAPDILTNLTYLQKLSLSHCELYGEVPIDKFLKLKRLTLLGLSNNNLSLVIGKSSSNITLPPIEVLGLRSCNLSGEIPYWIMNLTNLTFLDLEHNNLHGEIPSSLFRLVNLATLYLGYNSLQGQLELDMFLKLKMLTFLGLSNNKLSLLAGKSSPNVTLPPILELELNRCNLSGGIPSWIMNLTTLSYLSLQDNNLHGEVSHSLFRLENLATLSLANNFLEGRLELDMFLKLKKLTFLSLSGNKLSLHNAQVSYNATLPPLEAVDLGACNLVELPDFFRDLNELGSLDLSSNDLKSIPNWMWSKRNLQSLYLSNNSLTGEISQLICNLKSLVALDLSNNNLSGIIPSCLGSFSQSLQTLILQGNKLFGHIPQSYMIGSDLRMIDFSNNNLEGRLPRALVNCKMLELLDVSHNHINDSFPFWLGTLPELKVIGLSYNKFHGAIMCPNKCTFPKLHIIDLSHNQFLGNLSLEIIKSWKSMAASDTSQLRYEDNSIFYNGKSWSQNWGGYNHYSFTMSNKGVILDYMELQQFYNFIAIDLSSNRISGEIPDIMGDLKALVLLNLSSNMFIGNIPSSLGMLTNLEALDLSFNNLSGAIPQELTELTFLGFFNVSFNNLSGRIPENKQFSTFQGNSFLGNQDLCGIQLLKKCEDHAQPPSIAPTDDQDSDSGTFFEFDWKIVLIGYGGGLVAGLALGSAFSVDVLRWVQRFF